MISAHVGASGLVLDIIGVIFLFRYGLPPDVNRHGGAVLLSPVRGRDENEIKKAKHYDRMSRLALSLLVTGFVLQIISSYLPG